MEHICFTFFLFFKCNSLFLRRSRSLLKTRLLTSCYRSIGSNLRPFSAVLALSHQVKRRSHLKLHLQTRNYAGIGLLSQLPPISVG